MSRVVFLKVSAFLVLFISYIFPVQAQNSTLSISNVGICNTPTVLVPITGSNLNNIGSMTLFISFDDQSLAFDTITNLDPQLNGLLFNLVSNPARVAIVWSNINGAQFQNSTLLKLKFNVLKETGTLAFTSNCEIATVSLQILSVTYVNGSVYPAIPVITTQPENKTVKSQANALFQVVSSNATLFAWQETRNSGISWQDLADGASYTGSHSAALTINHVPTLFNKYRYRCLLKQDNCPATSNYAILTVDSVSGLDERHRETSLQIFNKPNPFSGVTNIEFTVPAQGSVSINIYSLMGKCMVNLINEQYVKGVYNIENNFVSLPSGIYVCQYVFKTGASVFISEHKMIKINDN